MKTVEEKITLLRLYFLTRRGVGHSSALVNGIANMDSVILARDFDDLKYMSRMSRKMFVPAITWTDDRFMDITATDKPLVITDAAIVQILGEVLDELKFVRGELQIAWEILHAMWSGKEK